MFDERVLVTGGSGFLGAYTIAALLNRGFQVRTTVRSLGRADDVRRMVSRAGADASSIEIVAADLSSDDGWASAVKDCHYVLHVASPFPAKPPKDENELIRPARDGALRVLRASVDAGVARVVLTSSFAAVGYGTAKTSFTEEDWTDTSHPSVRAYVKSKTVAEQAAWDFVKDHPELELSVINPVAIFGPVLDKDTSTSIEIVQRMLSGKLPGVPRLAFGVVDVRDVADLELLCMLDRRACGERLLAVSGDFMTMGQIAGTLRDRLGAKANKVPTRVIPDGVIKLAGRFVPELGDFAAELGVLRQADGSKASRLLGWQPRPRETTLVDTANSLFEHGLA